MLWFELGLRETGGYTNYYIPEKCGSFEDNIGVKKSNN